MTRNELAHETSPYLLQHRDNPVHWMAWTPAALHLAKQLDRPILLSVGYAACHWCHVMAHESFEDSDTAALMNAHFVNIKVDREERPDVDRIYMQALHALGEQGGWPLTMFLTPDAEPFWGGTYFPPESRYGRPGFPYVLNEIARIWRDERDKVIANSSALLANLRDTARPGEGGALDPSTLRQAAAVYLRAVDLQHGGLQGAPKFPQAPLFAFLWTMAKREPLPEARQAVETTLRHITQGGIYDHLGGGIARYSVDGQWLVPHFEKMLYDNAQLVGLLSRTLHLSGDGLFRQRLTETVGFLLRDMITPEGAFAASYDADSEGVEGKFYVWTDHEIRALLPPADIDLFCRTYDVKPGGNWDGHTILNRLQTLLLADAEEKARLAHCRAALFAVRAERIPPGYDDKVLADWNGLAIHALADAALTTANRDWRNAAVRAFEAVLLALWTGETLHHSFRAGKVRHHATAEGYAHLIGAALALHGLTAEQPYLTRAVALCRAMDRHHWDEAAGGYFFASNEAADVIVRQRSGQDDVTPNANGAMLRHLTHLHLLTGDEIYRAKAEAIISAHASAALGNPFGYASLLDGFAAFDDAVQIVATGPVGDPLGQPLLRQAIERMGPDSITLYATDAGQLPAHHPAYRKTSPSGTPRLYICRGQTCAAPAETEAQVAEAFQMLGL